MILKLFILCLFLSATVICQDQNFDTEQNQQPNVDYEAQMRNRASMMRTACLVLSRYHSNSYKEIIDQVVASLPPIDQQKYINKLYAVAVERCMPLITEEEAAQFFQTQQNFDPSTMFSILDGIDYPSIANDVENLTPNQKGIIKFMKSFDEEMAVRKEEREAAEEQGQSEDQFGLFGVSVKNFNSFGGYLYIGILASILIGAFVWGFKQLNNSSLPKNKKKKSKANKKEN